MFVVIMTHSSRSIMVSYSSVTVTVSDGWMTLVSDGACHHMLLYLS